jgi:hypothetical protein
MSGGTPGFHTSSGRVTELRAVNEGAVPASAPATSRLFVLPVAARRWVSTDNTLFLEELSIIVVVFIAWDKSFALWRYLVHNIPTLKSFVGLAWVREIINLYGLLSHNVDIVAW